MNLFQKLAHSRKVRRILIASFLCAAFAGSTQAFAVSPFPPGTITDPTCTPTTTGCYVENGVIVGQPVFGGTAKQVIYTDNSGNVISDSNFTRDSATQYTNIAAVTASNQTSAVNVSNNLLGLGLKGAGISSADSGTNVTNFVMTGDATGSGLGINATVSGLLNSATGDKAYLTISPNIQSGIGALMDVLNGHAENTQVLSKNSTFLSFASDNTTTAQSGLTLGASSADLQFINASSNKSYFRAASDGLHINYRGVDWVWPTADGAAGRSLTTDSHGVLSWAIPAQNNVFPGDIFLGDTYPNGANGGNLIRLDNSYGNVVVGTLVPLLPINDNKFIGDTFMGDAPGNGLDFSLQSNRNTWIGQYVARSAHQGNDDTYVGSEVGDGWLFAGTSNLALGTESFGQVTTGLTAGSNNTMVGGYQAGYNATGSNDVFVGAQAGANTTGSSSTAVGRSATTGIYSNSIALGAGAASSAAHQFMVGAGSATGFISQMQIILNSAGTQTCVIDVTGANCSSDERLKTNITDLPANTLDALSRIRTVSFNWGSDPTGTKDIGFLAQNMIEEFPEVVSTNAAGYYMVNYSEMVPAVVKGIKELNIKVNDIRDLTNATGQTFMSNLASWLGSRTNGLVRIFAGEVDTNTVQTINVNASQLCLGETCVTEQELKQLLESQHTPSAPSGTSGGTGGTITPPDSTTGTDVTPPPENNDGTGSAGGTASDSSGTTTGGDTGSAPAGGDGSVVAPDTSGGSIDGTAGASGSATP